MNEMQLELLRYGKIPLRFGNDELPLEAHEQIFELMEFVSALAHGYMRLYNRTKIMEKWRRDVESR